MKHAAFLSFLLITAPALADQPTTKTDWYLLLAQKAKCIIAKKSGFPPEFASPALLEADARRRGEYVKTLISRDEGGKISGASVVVRESIDQDVISILFFSTKEGCEAFLKQKIDDGSLHDPSELQ